MSCKNLFVFISLKPPNLLMFNDFRLPSPALNQAERISTTRRHAVPKTAATLSPMRSYLSKRAAAWCRYNMILVVKPQAQRNAYALLRAILSSACRGTPFQFEFAGELLPFAQGRPQLAPSFRLPPRQGAYTPAELGELNAATRRFIAPKTIGLWRW